MSRVLCPPPQVLASLRPLQPRLYSISSTILEAAAGVQVTVAEVRYSALHKEREGVCSTYLSSRLQVRGRGEGGRGQRRGGACRAVVRRGRAALCQCR